MLPFTEITCDDLPALDNAVISYSSATSPRPIDTVATYQCVDGYTLEGAVTRTCGEDGMFDGEEPRCVLIRKCTLLNLNFCKSKSIHTQSFSFLLSHSSLR